MVSTALPPLAPAASRALQQVSWELPYRALRPLAEALIGHAPGVVFLDSGGPIDEGSRWNVLAARPSRVVRWSPGRPRALAALRRVVAQTETEQVDDNLPFHGGWLGWFAYDFGRQLERVPALTRGNGRVPDFVLGEYPHALLEDRLERRLYGVATLGRYDSGETIDEHREAIERLAGDANGGCGGSHVSAGAPRADLARDAYLRAVERVLTYIEAGDVYQANFAHRFETHVSGSSAALYARLADVSPAPFGGYWGLPGAPELFSVSPELFLRLEGADVTTEPIKGTRPRDQDPERDAILRAELADSEKERAELLMIVYLLRNDLGRVAAIGSVSVPCPRRLTAHPTVHHASAVVAARLRDGCGAVDLLAATMPGGSISGAPKIRAMEILEELEPVLEGFHHLLVIFLGLLENRLLVVAGVVIFASIGGNTIFSVAE